MTPLQQQIENARTLQGSYDALVEEVAALKGDDPDVTMTSIDSKLSAIPSEETMKQLYAARAEQNNDGDNTYTIILPYTAQVEETPDGYQITL